MPAALPIIAVAKVKLLGLSKYPFTANPILATFIWPFCLKVLYSLRPIKDIFEAVVHDSNLFVFQLGRIITAQDHVPAGTARPRRWERALRLAHERIIVMAQRSVDALAADDDSFHTVSMVAL